MKYTSFNDGLLKSSKEKLEFAEKKISEERSFWISKNFINQTQEHLFKEKTEPKPLFDFKAYLFEEEESIMKSNEKGNDLSMQQNSPDTCHVTR